MYFAGMFDGDGCIFFSKTILCEIRQCSSDGQPPPVLLHFQRYFGGKIRLSTKKTSQQRDSFLYSVASRLALRLIEIIAKFGVLKQVQAKMVLQHVAPQDPGGFRMYFRDSAVLEKNLQQAKREYASIPIEKSQLTLPWISGFTDAEGCVYWRDGAKMQVTQKNSPRVIALLAEMMGASITKNRFTCILYGANSIEWMKKVRPWLRVKDVEVDLIVDHYETIQTFPKRGFHEQRKDLESFLLDHLRYMKHGDVQRVQTATTVAEVGTKRKSKSVPYHRSLSNKQRRINTSDK